MKLRPYLRGLGIGIIVTAIILHFSLKTANGAPMTDSEIKARAAELGMIEKHTVDEYLELEMTFEGGTT